MAAATATATAASPSTAPSAGRKTRQTRIPEHLKTVKKALSKSQKGSAPRGGSTTVFVTQSSSTPASMSSGKNQELTPSTNRNLEAVIAAQSAAAASAADKARAMFPNMYSVSLSNGTAQSDGKVMKDSNTETNKRLVRRKPSIRKDADTPADSARAPGTSPSAPPFLLNQKNAEMQNQYQQNGNAPFIVRNTHTPYPATIDLAAGSVGMATSQSMTSLLSSTRHKRQASSSLDQHASKPSVSGIPSRPPPMKRSHTSTGIVPQVGRGRNGSIIPSSAASASPRSKATAMPGGSSSALALSISADGKARLAPQLSMSSGGSAMTRSSTLPNFAGPTPMIRSHTTASANNDSRYLPANHYVTNEASNTSRALVREPSSTSMGKRRKTNSMSSGSSSSPALSSRYNSPFFRSGDALDSDMQLRDVSSTASTSSRSSSYFPSPQQGQSLPSINGFGTPPACSSDLSVGRASFALPPHPQPPQDRQTVKKEMPIYPDKERLQSSWKFPVQGLALTAPAVPSYGSQENLAGLSMLGPVPSSFPSMNSLNTSITQVIRDEDNQTFVSPAEFVVDMAEKEVLRKSRIQAWLDSPDMTLDGPHWSIMPKDGSKLDGSEMSSAADEAGLALAESLNRTPRKNSKPSYEMQEDDGDGVHVSGRSVKSSKLSRSRAFGESDSTSPTMKESQANTAGQSILKSPPKQQTGSRPATASSTAGSASAIKKAGKGRKGKSGRKSGTNECICDKGDDGEPMVQCDTCSNWYHLECLMLEDEELKDEWHCFRCTSSSALGDVANAARLSPGKQPTLTLDREAERSSAAAYPSPVSMASQPPLAPPAEIWNAQVRAATTSTPYQQKPVLEPAFTHPSTPQTSTRSHFEDSDLVLAPAPTQIAFNHAPYIAHTPGYAAPASAAQMGHRPTYSLSRSYGPVTPKIGYTPTSSETSSSTMTSGFYTNDMSLYTSSYSPRTPAHPFHQRPVPVKHNRTLSSAMQFHFDAFQAGIDGGPPPMHFRKPSMDTGRHWDSYRPASPPKIPFDDVHHPSSLALQSSVFPMTPPMSVYQQATAHHPSAPHNTPDGFLPPLDPEEAARQSFLELNSTPSGWGHAPQFDPVAW